MAVPEEALLNEQQRDELKKTILSRIQFGKRFWLPLNHRQDLWATSYFLLDVVQQLKPLGYRRFVSNEPRTAVDAAISILTRNETFWRIALNEVGGENMDERRMIGKVERTLQGIVYDIDENFRMRGQMRFWKQAASQAVLRGWVWGKVHVTSDALKYRDAPIIAEIYDSRTVYPHFDAFGLAYVCIERLTTLGELVNLYPETFADYEQKPDYDPNQAALKIEYWSNTRGERPGVTGVFAAVSGTGTAGGTASTDTVLSGQDSRWIIPPYAHGYTPSQLPVVGVPVNGVNLIAKPMMGDILAERISKRAELLDIPQLAYWQNQANSWVAETGRSLLSAVEEQIPQYNELIATIFQHFSVGTFGTWVFHTPTGELPEFEPGIEAQVALRPEERVERLEPQAITADAYRLVQILQDERQKGVLSNILQSVVPFEGTGVLFQQVSNAALNALEPYHDGMEEFGTAVGTALLGQLQAAGSEIRKFSVFAPGSTAVARRQSFFVVEFDPNTDLEPGRRYRPRPVFKPALPDDLAVRINAARLALDPRRPILSLVTVLENILQIDDPTEEIDRIWEDIANTDPIIVLEQIADALERLNEPELAARIRQNEFRASFLEELQFRQATGNIPGPPNMGANNMPPEAGANQFATERTGRGEQAAMPGFEGAGEMGERTTV